MKNTLQDIIISHFSAYPEMELSDYIKLIYQNEFGCGHMLSDLSDSQLYLISEYNTALEESNNYENSTLFIEAIGNGLCRVHLNPLKIVPEFLPMLNLLFAATANNHSGSISEFKMKTSLLYELAVQNLLPLNSDTVESYLKEYFLKECPPMHHSEAYRVKYHPHYRVIKKAYSFYFPVFKAVKKLIECGRPVIISIDGRCGSGKSILSGLLSEVFDCNVFHMDDFFLPFNLRTEERLSQPGGNVDYERFMHEILKPLSEGKDIRFQPFNCSTGELKPSVYKPASPLSIVEGSYSLHPALIKEYDFKVFLTCSPEVQQRRILQREGREMLEQFIKKWIPLEESYLSALAVADRCDLVLDTTNFMAD